MCGLFGIYPKAGADPLSLRILALFLGIGNINRGRHSFGVWSKGIEPFRALGALNDEANIPGFRGYVFNAWNPEAGHWFAGHTRQATHGGKTLENCHPFNVGTLTLAHNGVVTVEGYTDKDHAVDSGRIAMSIVEHGWQPGLANVSGSCALLASVDGNLLVYRHNQILHMVEGDWGWAISSEKSTLMESIFMAGLVITAGPVETPADHVVAPWDGVSQHCPAKAYVAPSYDYKTRSYSNGYYDKGTFHYYKDEENEAVSWHNRNQCNGQAQPLPLITRNADQEAKDKFLKPATSKCGDKVNTARQFEGESVFSEGAIQRCAREYIMRCGRDTAGNNIALGPNSRIRKAIIEMAINVERHEKMIQFKIDPETKATVRTITPLELPEAWYLAQVEDCKDELWSKFYARLLLRMGVTMEDYRDAIQDHMAGITDDDTNGVEAVAEIDDTDGTCVCDWCGTVRFTMNTKVRNFGTGNIVVCKWCDTDFEAARRGLDFRDNKGGRRDQRRRKHERKTH